MSRQTIEGFYFDDAAVAATAAKEAETVKYIRSKTNFERIDAVYAIYTKLIDNNVFSTAVGYSFLAELYRILSESGRYSESDLPKIYISVKQTDTQKVSASSADITDRLSEEELSAEEEARIVEAVHKRTQSLKDTSRTQVRNIREMYRDKQRNYKIVIAVLAAVIIGMLAMVYFSDSSPLLDAEQQVLDKYSAWQEELQLQEQELKAWEADLLEREQRLSE